MIRCDIVDLHHSEDPEFEIIIDCLVLSVDRARTRATEKLRSIQCAPRTGYTLKYIIHMV
jgi:hypothetical protein